MLVNAPSTEAREGRRLERGDRVVIVRETVSEALAPFTVGKRATVFIGGCDIVQVVVDGPTDRAALLREGLAYLLDKNGELVVWCRVDRIERLSAVDRIAELGA